MNSAFRPDLHSSQWLVTAGRSAAVCAGTWQTLRPNVVPHGFFLNGVPSGKENSHSLCWTLMTNILRMYSHCASWSSFLRLTLISCCQRLWYWIKHLLHWRSLAFAKVLGDCLKEGFLKTSLHTNGTSPILRGWQMRLYAGLQAFGHLHWPVRLSQIWRSSEKSPVTGRGSIAVWIFQPLSASLTILIMVFLFSKKKKNTNYYL